MITKEQAYKKIEDLVIRFEEQFSSYKKSDYNETLTRRDFIDPFFKALGWDIDNEQGYAEAYREVIHEDKIKIGNATKAPDYSFRIGGGKRLFFVEAKKPSVDVKGDIAPAYQVRRYGWSAKLPISIITDFEEFAVYDCTKKPNPTDKASVSRINYLNFKDYLANFDFLWDTFSKEKVLKGSFDKYVQSTANKKGTATVDKEFLQSLDTWRTLLAENFAKCNKDLDEDEINFVVQQTIDRLIFLRIAEDRGVEPYGNLQSVLKQGDYYKNLFDVFRQADDKYNSGLFDFKKDTISKNLSLENKVIKTIINQLYYPESPYEFSVLSVEILGSAYEQFLGKQITLSKSGKAIIEEKPDVRKAGGVYYTPQYIVDYIVENTLGKLCENKTPKQVSELTVCDPACGSGSFLLGAYQYLLDWHKNYYIENGKANKIKKDSPLTIDGNLTTSEKKRILLNNIYGVDIDVNAVEVTKLSLLLKCMEGETSATIAHQISMFNERVLPTLDSNIKSGNSLIDLDFYETQLDFGEEKKVKPFSWQKAFPNMFKRNGFDVVIGNPPYLGGREWKEENGNAYDYFIKKYQIAEYQFDIYALFWEAGIKLLNKEGLIGFITPNTWLNNQSNLKLRTYILENTIIQNIVDYSKIKVFELATVLPIITILNNNTDKKIDTQIFEPFENSLNCVNCINQNIWQQDELKIININLKLEDIIIRNKIESKSTNLENLALIKFGIKVYQTGKGNPKQTSKEAIGKVFEAKTKISDSYLKYLKGKDISQNQINWNGDWLNYGKHLAEPRTIELFKGERILVRRIVGKTLIASYISDELVTGQLLQIVKPYIASDTKYLTGILNSKLIAYYFKKKYNRQDKTFPEIRIYELCALPIKILENGEEPIKILIAELVNKLIELNEEIKSVSLETKKEQIQNRISFSEDKINALVYQLYDLNEDEIKIVEGK